MQLLGYDTNDTGTVHGAMIQPDMRGTHARISFEDITRSLVPCSPFNPQEFMSAAGTHFSHPDYPACLHCNIHDHARNVDMVLPDSNLLSPGSSGACALTTQTLLERTARTVYHITIRHRMRHLRVCSADERLIVESVLKTNPTQVFTPTPSVKDYKEQIFFRKIFQDKSTKTYFLPCKSLFTLMILSERIAFYGIM